MTTERDYNLELADVAGSKYAYNFDFDVMHPTDAEVVPTVPPAGQLPRAW